MLMPSKWDLGCVLYLPYKNKAKQMVWGGNTWALTGVYTQNTRTASPTPSLLCVNVDLAVVCRAGCGALYCKHAGRAHVQAEVDVGWTNLAGKHRHIPVYTQRQINNQPHPHQCKHFWGKCYRMLLELKYPSFIHPFHPRRHLEISIDYGECGLGRSLGGEMVKWRQSKKFVDSRSKAKAG